MKAIIEWFKSLFSNNEVKTQEQNDTNREVTLTGETDTGINFHPELVERLKDDHQGLLGGYTTVMDKLNNRDYASIPPLLQGFKSAFNKHLSEENIKFYGYLEKLLKDDSEEHKKMRAFRREMNAIANQVNKFLNTWIDFGIDSKTADQFREELSSIGAALVKRVENEEENLYPIYKK